MLSELQYYRYLLISSQTNHSTASLAPNGLHQMEQRQASVLKMRNPKTVSRITTATGRAPSLGEEDLCNKQTEIALHTWP